MAINDKMNGHAVPPLPSRVKASEAMDPTPPSIGQAKNVKEIRAAMATLKERDAAVTAKLNTLMATQKEFSRELGRLDLLRAQLGTQAVATRSISNNMLADAAITAGRISGAVQKLDLEQERVKATLQVVEQVAELKACVQGVTGSMEGPQDWETAAGYLHRASKVPEEIVRGPFAEEIVPSAEIPDPPYVTLENAAQSLCGLFLREFDKAVKENEGAKVTRFFKLFPLIGRSEVGLDVYGKYVCQGVADHARGNLNAGTGGAQSKEGYFYANALSKLFEYIASIVERHGGLVERHYGEGRMVRVIQRLQYEADSQGGIIIDTWTDERQIDRKITDIKSYAFTFLVQSFLPVSSTRNPVARTGSPATFERKSGEAQRGSVEDPTDMKEVDAFLNEMGMMLGRWSLYCRFIAAKCEHPPSSAEGERTLTLPDLLESSSLFKKVNNHLIEPFNIMSTFYVRRSVERAFQLDEQPSDLTLNPNKNIPTEGPYVTSAVDDVMYIVNQVIQRTVATSQREVIANTIPTIARILSSDFIGMCQRKMRDECYPRAIVQGGLPPEQTIISFLVMMNDLDVAMDYVKRIITSRIDPTGELRGNYSRPSEAMHDVYPFNSDAVFVTNALHSLQTGFESKTKELLNEGVQVMFKNVMGPRLRPVLNDAFRDIEYDLTSSDLDELNRIAEENNELSLAAEDAVLKRFQPGWKALTKPIARLATEANFEKLLTVTIKHHLATQLEKKIWSYYGRINSIGGVRLERDVANIVGLVCGGGRYALRESFARCTQICLFMNMEAEEWEELLEAERLGDDTEWQLDTEERARAKGMVRN